MNDSLFLDWFDAQVQRAPTAPAVVCDGRVLAYGELAEQAAVLAARLRESGTTEGSSVLLHAERSLELIVGMIGILRAGSAFVAIDPINPRARVQQLSRALRPAAAVTTSALAANVEADRLVLLDGGSPRVDKHLAQPAVDPRALA
jgi:non-ribosomal peptide synthetase component F